MHWGDEWVIYNHQSGDTHLIECGSGDILEYCLAQQQVKLEEIGNLFDDGSNAISDKSAAAEFLMEQLVKINIFVAIN